MVSGTFTNNGFIIIADTELNDRFNYKSSDASTASQRPKLVIQYTTSTPTPGPSPTPTNTPAGPTATPTRTPTPGASNTPTPTAPPAFQNATFVYDGDGKRVKSIINPSTGSGQAAITTYFVGAHYEVTGSTITKYYYAGAQRIAMRSNGTLSYLLGDHLGSTSLTTDAAGDIVSEIRYKAWGTVRYATEGVPTKYQYTGQYSYEAEFGLYFYNARWYDPVLSRFAQADTIIPPGVQGLDRYAYVQNNPLLYVDPSGHCGIEKDQNGNETAGNLDCTAKDIAGWSMAYRLRWLKLLTSAAGASDWFHNIEGVIESFDENNLGETALGEGTDDWFSWTDAGLLESIQDGYAGKTEGAAGKWYIFFRSVAAKEDRATLKILWGQAEQAGIRYGEGIAADHGHAVPEDAKDFLLVGNVYRSVAGVPYGGELLGGGLVALPVGALGFRTCGPLCAVGGALIGGAGGGYLGGAATYPGTDINGHHPVYYIANALLGSK